LVENVIVVALDQMLSVGNADGLQRGILAFGVVNNLFSPHFGVEKGPDSNADLDTLVALLALFGLADSALPG